jgi:transcriptional regulator GlxA family with amidase domain
VCTGALILAAVALLEGRQATTHWAYHRLLERLGATYVGQRWVEDSKFITSVGCRPAGDLLEGLEALAVLLGVELAAGQPLGQDVLGAGPWLLAGLSLLVGPAGVP